MAYYNHDPGYEEAYDEYYLSDGYDDNDYDEDYYLVDCPHCPSQVKQSNYNSHIEKVHGEKVALYRCDECGNKMSKRALQSHKERKHMETCQACGVKMLSSRMEQHVIRCQVQSHKRCKYCTSNFRSQNALEKHVASDHPLQSTFGMICLDKITDAEFNKLVAENRIFSKDGHLFKKL